MPEADHNIANTLAGVLSRKRCMYGWRPAKGTNFGDELGPAIVTRCLEREGIPERGLRRCINQRHIVRRKRKLLSVGSILQLARGGDIVWGSGVNGHASPLHYDFRGIDFRAVRGPLTREMVLNNGGQCPEVFGDPALLVPKLFPELPTRSNGDAPGPLVFVANLYDEVLPSRSPASTQGHAIETVPTQLPWQQIAEKIIAAPFVVSSSLHGIILADAFGVPCRPYQSLFEPLFKFEDYFLATGRSSPRFAHTLDEAMDLGPIPPMDYDPEPLLAAFPLDAFS